MKSERVALYYQAADIYLHVAKIESFGNTILEARACGIPVVATAVGGIPEQVKGLRLKVGNTQYGSHSAEEASGILVPEGDSGALAVAMGVLLKDESLRNRLGKNASEDARMRFDLKLQAETFLSWYEEILSKPNDGHAVRG